MNKRMIYGLLGIFLLVVVTGATIGQVLTQEQLDSIDVDNKSLNTEWTESYADLVTKCEDKNYCSREYSYETIEKEYLLREITNEQNETYNESYWTNNTVVTERRSKVRFKTKPFYEEEQRTNKSSAKTMLNDFLEKRLLIQIEEEKDRIKELQTEVIYDISDTLDEINY